MFDRRLPASSTSLSSMTTMNQFMMAAALIGMISSFVPANAQIVSTPPPVEIAGIFDLDNLPWAQTIWNFTFSSIDQPWLQRLVPQLAATSSTSSSSVKPTFVTPLKNARCDSTTAVREYWSLREANNKVPPDALIGCYCSSATMSLSRVSGLEGVPVVSPFSTSSQLSNVEEFPHFTRLLAPDDYRGEVAALVSALNMFGWDRVSIIATDTQYAQDWEREFRHLWSAPPINGESHYSTTIRTNLDDTLDVESARVALEGIPTDNPTINSRIILLLAHSQHAYPILQLATEISSVLPDTIWVGPSSWVGSDVVFAPENRNWISRYPGFLGAVPFQNKVGTIHQTFLQELNKSTPASQNTWGTASLPAFAPQLIDSILSTAIALAGTNNNNPTGAFSVTSSAIQSIEFDGVSGKVRFTETGDLNDPQYTIALYQFDEWASVGITGTQLDSAERDRNSPPLCFPVTGCVQSLNDVPDDSYPVPKTPLPLWAIVVIGVVVVLLLAVAFKYWRSHRSKKSLKREFKAFQESIVGMRTAQVVYIPTPSSVLSASLTSSSTTKTLDSDVEQPLPHTVKGKDGKTSLKVEPQIKVVWCWKETSGMMGTHDVETIEGDPSDCWIKYDEDSNEVLEAAYRKGSKSCKPMKGYVVNFSSMKQTKTKTGFEREVKRIVVDPLSSSVTSSAVVASSLTLEQQRKQLQPRTVDLTKARYGTALPDDIRNEPQMVLVEGDIIQVSKHHDGGWAFGTKLHHQDEAMAREIVSYANSFTTLSDDASAVEEASIFSDTGWFPLDATILPSADDLKTLEKTVGGDASALEAPSHWDPVKDPTVVQLHRLKQGDPERAAVLNAFRSTLSNRTLTSVHVDRIQNLAMWQSYIVKRRTICVRDIKHKTRKRGKDGDDNSADAAKEEAEQMRRAVERFERCWLWHGTNADVKDKIMQQGFNRSFCGKNATKFGKGVYFARDASYSSYKTYAVPDPSNGNMQYILACRVAVGEYCPGVKDALTPNVRDVKTQTLYDSTVGLLSKDTMADPSIYVTYHDAQAYPEYLISFRQA